MSNAQHNARLGNTVRDSGVDRCYCGCKYWESDRCIDCGSTEPMPDDPPAPRYTNLTTGEPAWFRDV